MSFLKKIKLCFFVSVLTISNAFHIASQAQTNKSGDIYIGEKGTFPIYNYSAKSYNAAPQNWAVLQDKRGVLYFGNNRGVLEYDGTYWRLIEIANETNVRSLTMDEAGRVYIGASGEIGYLEIGPTGITKYHSLLDQVSKNDLEFTEVWSTVSTTNGIYFQTDNKIFRWDGISMKSWMAEKSFHRIFNVNDHVFVRQREIGLMEFVGDQLIPIIGGEMFADESIYSMVPLKSNSSQNILLCTKKKGLYLMQLIPDKSGNGKSSVIIESFKTQADPFLIENVSYNLIKSKSIYSIATVTNGIAVVDSIGKLYGNLNKSTGIQDEIIYSQLVDASNNLWIASSNGISRVVIHSPITSFNEKNGLSGTVFDIVRHNKILYVVTNYGVSFLNPGYISNEKNINPANFVSIPSAPEECWNLLSFRAGKYTTLLGVSSNNIFSIDDNKKCNEVLPCKPWCIYQSRIDSSRVFIGLENGLTSIYWDGVQWQKEVEFSEIKESVHSISEDQQGNLWLGHDAGAIKITFKSKEKALRKIIRNDQYTVYKYNSTSGLPDRLTVEIENINGEITFGTLNGIYKYENNKFIKNAELESGFSEGERQIHRMTQEKSNSNIWLETYVAHKQKFELGYLKKEKDNTYSWNTTPFLPYAGEIINSFYNDEDGITWFGGTEGLHRYDSNLDMPELKPYSAIIRKVTMGMDSTIFNGTFFDSLNISSLTQNQSLKSVISYANNSVVFEFSSLDFTNEKEEKFQYFLEGFDKGWSNWKHETKVAYTNLPEGNHVFHVKSKNIFNQESIEATYEFIVLPPWYRTWWSYVLYALGSIGFIFGVVTYTSRGLKAIILERTAEIVNQKEVIEYKNRNITDSINYAKRIQEAILPSKDLMRSRFPESFILYIPKDIVAGDFYWFAEKEGKFLIAACDCTGHGVPGAFMSLISYSLLNEVLLEKSFTNPAIALDALKQGIIKSLGQKGLDGEQKDGMDMSLVSLEVKLDDGKLVNKMSFAGANNPIYLIRKGELIEFTADKMPIGIYYGNDKPFNNKELILESGDTIYLFSDGYADQFGGEKGKKFTKKRYKELLLSIQSMSMSKQKDILENTLDTWLGDQQLIDDVLVMGIRIS